MILEVAKCLTAWLGHATYGVNALLTSTIPRESGDSAPSVATISDEFTNARSAGGRLPITLPALSIDVVASDVVENQVVQDQGDGRVTARIWYGTSNSDFAEAKREGAYVIRAVAASLRVLAREAHVASRTRNSVVFRVAQNGAVTVQPWFEQLDDRVVTAVASVTYDARDLLTLPS